MRIFAETDSGKQLAFSSVKDGNAQVFTLKKEKFQNAAYLRVAGGLTAAKAGDDGFYLVPRNISMIGDSLTRFTERGDCVSEIKRPIISGFGVKTPSLCAWVRVRRDYYYKFEIVCKDGNYSLSVIIDFTGDDLPTDDVRLEVIELSPDAGIAEMAAAERERRLALGEMPTLAEKCRMPAVEYARKYPLIRVRMGWKPSPSELPAYTPDTEPEMHVACDFKRVRDIADALKAHGVPGCELQLVGWNKGGHDGAFPQLFPVEPKLGGEEELRRTVEHVKKLGYRISLHTNSIDCFTLADTFSWDDVSRHRDGSVMQIGHYSGGYAYRVCLKKQFKNVIRDLPRVAGLEPNGLHFIDVISIVVPDTCHAPEHRSTVSSGIATARQIMAFARELFGGFSSEGCMDFAMRYLDYGLYTTFGDSFKKTREPLTDEYLPFWELCYHGILLYNPDSQTVNYGIKSPAERLRMFMRGGRPSFYFYTRFRTGGQKNWMGDSDLTCDNDDDLNASAEAIAKSCKEYAPLADRQLTFMTNFERRGALEIVTYADGRRMVGNFSGRVRKFEGQTVPAWDFIIV